MSSAPKFLIAYGSQYVALSGAEPRDGYEFIGTPAKALSFSLLNLAVDWLEVSGPLWARDMKTKGLLKVMRFVDGKVEAV